MAEAHETPPANTKEFVGTLPFRSQDVHDPEGNFDVSIWRSTANLCEFARWPTACDALTGLYYGSAEDEVTKFCPRHFYELHAGARAPYRLVDPPNAPGGQAEQAPQQPAPPAHPGHSGSWRTPEAWAAARADSQWAAERDVAKMRDRMQRYPLLHAEEKIRLAMDVLYDVLDTWDHDALEEYPDDLPEFEEYLFEIGKKLWGIRWHRPDRAA